MNLYTTFWKSFQRFLLTAILVGGCLPATGVFAAQSEAYIGQPLGVGRVTVDVMRGEPVLPLSDERFTAAERSGRALYPIVKVESVRQFLRGLLGVETPRTVTIYFLFRGDEPFDLSVYSPMEQGVRIHPQANPGGHQRLLGEWWEQLAGRWSSLQKAPEFPPVAENFLLASFARRLGRPIPEITSGLFGLKKKESALQELMGGETARLAVDRKLVLGDRDTDRALQQLPEPPNWRDTEIDPARLEGVEVEPLATCVPQECFYIRFGSFTNYFWFRDLSTKWDGDLKNMLIRRAISRRGSSRIEQQLSLKENALSRVLGPQFIHDAALIGMDPYVDQGGAIGLLVEAKNNFLLAQDFMRQRRNSLTTFPDATETTEKIGDTDVSLIATPDGRVRSYYAQAGNFHLVSTSRRMVERFLEANQGKDSLALLPSFQLARKKLALERDDSIFVFVPEKLFQNICTPQYWLESRRRLQAVEEPLLVELAQYAAQCEGLPALGSEELIATGILPQGFGQHVDGSSLEQQDDRLVDSLRGAAGYFLPVCDVTVENCTAAEARDYQQFITAFREEVGQMPPIAVAIHREPHAEGDTVRTLTLEATAEPLGNVQLGSVIDSLGEPIDEQIAPIEGDVISLQAVLNLPVPLIGGERQPNLLFCGLRDFRSPLTVRQGQVVADCPHCELVRGYVGAWPRPGILTLLQGPQPAQGPEPEPLGDQMWHAQAEKFLLISFKPDVIREVEPQLKFVPVDRKRQLYCHVEDLTGKQIAGTVNALGYMRARETSVAPSRLMNSLANLLQVPRPECKDFAERLLDGDVNCPLDGDYQLFETPQGLPAWSSTALPEQNRFLLTEVPEDFQLSLLDWFRGSEGDLCVADDQLSVHFELKMTADSLP